MTDLRYTCSSPESSLMLCSPATTSPLLKETASQQWAAVRTVFSSRTEPPQNTLLGLICQETYHREKKKDVIVHE